MLIEIYMGVGVLNMVKRGQVNPQNIQEAARLAVERAGYADVASAMGKAQQTLRNKLNPNEEHCNINVYELQTIATQHDPQHLVVRALAHLCGGVFIELPNSSMTDDECYDGMLQLVSDFGRMAEDYKNSRADGVVEPNEFAKVNTDAQRLIEHVVSWVETLRAQVRDTPKTKNPLPCIAVSK